MERDEVYVPKTRSDLNIPEEHPDRPVNYSDFFDESPLFTLYMLVRQQLLAFPAYLCTLFIKYPVFILISLKCTMFQGKRTIRSGQITLIVSGVCFPASRLSSLCPSKLNLIQEVAISSCMALKHWSPHHGIWCR
jgi:hypothetical protein